MPIVNTGLVMYMCTSVPSFKLQVLSASNHNFVANAFALMALNNITTNE